MIQETSCAWPLHARLKTPIKELVKYPCSMPFVNIFLVNISKQGILPKFSLLEFYNVQCTVPKLTQLKPTIDFKLVCLYPVTSKHCDSFMCCLNGISADMLLTFQNQCNMKCIVLAISFDLRCESITY